MCPTVFHLISAHISSRVFVHTLVLCVMQDIIVGGSAVGFISSPLMCQLWPGIHSSRRCLCRSAGPLRTHEARLASHKTHHLAWCWIICIGLWKGHSGGETQDLNQTCQTQNLSFCLFCKYNRWYKTLFYKKTQWVEYEKQETLNIIKIK